MEKDDNFRQELQTRWSCRQVGVLTVSPREGAGRLDTRLYDV